MAPVEGDWLASGPRVAKAGRGLALPAVHSAVVSEFVTTMEEVKGITVADQVMVRRRRGDRDRGRWRMPPQISDLKRRTI
jgi:hypothetical protein